MCVADTSIRNVFGLISLCVFHRNKTFLSSTIIIIIIGYFVRQRLSSAQDIRISVLLPGDAIGNPYGNSVGNFKSGKKFNFFFVSGVSAWSMHLSESFTRCCSIFLTSIAEICLSIM